MREHLRTMARYNRWANARLSAAVAAIDEDAYMAERGAFFGSIQGTLNHLLVADRLWLGRLKGDPYAVSGLDAIVCADRETLIAERAREDDGIVALVDGFDADRLEATFTYRTQAGSEHENRRRVVLAHMFNHATHHRGQAHGLLSQVPSDPPPLDLIYYLREA